MSRFKLMFFILFAFTAVLLAQDTTPFDWTSLGVNVGIIAAIIAIVQMVKQYLPEKVVVFVPIVLSAIAFFLIGQGDQPAENVLYWAAAAGYLWKIANQLTPVGVLKSKTEQAK